MKCDFRNDFGSGNTFEIGNMKYDIWITEFIIQELKEDCAIKSNDHSMSINIKDINVEQS